MLQLSKNEWGVREFNKEVWLRDHPKHTINADGTIDIDGIVSIELSVITTLPFRFGRVTGSFYCSYNYLTSLEGSPVWVGGDFYCQQNCLTTLQYAPEYVGGNFICAANKLTSLEHMPGYIGGNVEAQINPGNFTAEYIKASIAAAAARKYIRTLSYDDEVQDMGSIFD